MVCACRLGPLVDPPYFICAYEIRVTKCYTPPAKIRVSLQTEVLVLNNCSDSMPNEQRLASDGAEAILEK